MCINIYIYENFANLSVFKDFLRNIYPSIRSIPSAPPKQPQVFIEKTRTNLTENSTSRLLHRGDRSVHEKSWKFHGEIFPQLRWEDGCRKRGPVGGLEVTSSWWLNQPVWKNSCQNGNLREKKIIWNHHLDMVERQTIRTPKKVIWRQEARGLALAIGQPRRYGFTNISMSHDLLRDLFDALVF